MNRLMPGQARLDIPGALPHIMVRGIDKTNIFRDDEDKIRYLERLGRIVTVGKCVLYSWGLMDNHVHLIFKSGETGISTAMRKLFTGYGGVIQGDAVFTLPTRMPPGSGEQTKTPTVCSASISPKGAI
jgi:hypothetical protein